MWLYEASSLYLKTCWQSLCRVFPTGEMGEYLHQPNICSFTPFPSNFYSLPPKVNSTQQKNKNVIFSCSHCSCTIFVLISYSFETQIMIILILIEVQYSQNAVFSFGKFSNRQNHSSSDFNHLVKKFPLQCSLFFDTKSGKLLKILGEKEQ